MSSSPFGEDWRACLRAHYQYVVRGNDEPTRKTLTGVLYQVGFTEDELHMLYINATLHVDDLPEGFTPDLTVMAAIAEAATAPPTSVPPPDLIAVAEAALSAAEASADSAADDEDAAPPSDDQPHADPDAPQQMSLF
jgi:ribosomal protein L12E/L44/L45/RPP1/RPP2